jgi:AraC-like DNA-binding protein
MPKLVFSTDEFPEHLDDQARFRLWRDVFASRFGECEMSRAEDVPFSSVLEFVQFGELAITRRRTTIEYWERTSRHVAADASDHLLIGFNRSLSPPTLNQRGREVVVSGKGVALFSNAEPVQVRAAKNMAAIGIAVPRARLVERVGHTEDLTLVPLDVMSPAMQHLQRYAVFLLAADGDADDPLLAAHVETTLLDLMALALGANRDVAQIAQMRGLRAARLQEILAAIKAGYANSAFAVRGVAEKLGVSPRYVNDLLHETGLSLAERVLELRLQKARAMLADPRHDRLKIIEIAYACGFNEVSYFNRCFRRRFGASPTQYRGTASDRR